MSTLVLALAPATAAAQAPPPDERAAAQAFADITLPAAHEIAAATDAMSGAVPACKSDRRLERGTKRQRMRMFEFVIILEIAKLTRAVEPTLARTATALDAVPTADPILQDGREAWHRVHRMYGRIAQLEPERVCSVQRDYVRGGYKPTRAMRRAQRIFRIAMRWDTTWIDRAMAKATKRMIALGVTPENADGFDGELEPAEKPEDDSKGNGRRDGNAKGNGKGKGKKATAAQAPAPSSPLASLIAAR